VNSVDGLLKDIAVLADTDIDISRGRVYTIDQREIFYFNFFPFPTSNADYYSAKTLEQLAELKKYSLVIADFSKERMTHYVLCKVFEQLGINFVMLTHDITQHKSRPKLLYYPILYHWVRYQFKRRQITTLPKKYKLSCLNGTLRWHRVYNYFLLKSRADFDDYLCTLHSQPELEKYLNTTFRADTPDDIIQQWESIKHQLPHRNNINLKSKIRADWDISHPAYTNSYINLVTETDMSNAFVTEKTWKPVASAQLFLIVGHRSAVAHLRSLGVDTFDDIVDHDYYDSEPDWQIRIQKIHKVLDQLLSQDLESIYQLTRQRRIANTEKFFNGEFGVNYQNDLITFL
jgi:hypothetical protein